VLDGDVPVTLNGNADVWGVGVVQHIDAAAMELFLSYRNYSGDFAKEDAKDMDVVMGGARIRF
ncbi:MAG TPA: porin, partial [Hyphomicrobiaceae bacterium]|nr:porin [Hyphomicrobiaceae bacterium]